jgi:hypothetical protein
MCIRFKVLAAAVAVALVAMPVTAVAQNYRAKADGYQVVSSQSTLGSATFQATVDRANKTITYTLKYKDLQGDIIQSHIHFNRPGFNGGIILFLCTNGTPPPGTHPPLCDHPREGTVSFTAPGADVVHIPFGNQFPAGGATGGDQGFTPGDFDGLVRALDAGAGYIVVHTAFAPSGELRGQIGRDERER